MVPPRHHPSPLDNVTQVDLVFFKPPEDDTAQSAEEFLHTLSDGVETTPDANVTFVDHSA